MKNKILRSLFMIILLQNGFISFSQRIVVGRVVDDETKAPLAGATITVKGNSINTITNRLGYFQITVDSLDALIISLQDYEALTFNPPKDGRFQIGIKRTPIEFFKDGTDAFYKFIGKNIKYPASARGAKKVGYVYVSFQIDSAGNLKNLEIDNDIDGGCGTEVIRVLKRISAEFLPDTSNSTYVLPVQFRIGPDDTEYPKPQNIKNGKLLPEMVVRAMQI